MSYGLGGETGVAKTGQHRATEAAFELRDRRSSHRATLAATAFIPPIIHLSRFPFLFFSAESQSNTSRGGDRCHPPRIRVPGTPGPPAEPYVTRGVDDRYHFDRGDLEPRSRTHESRAAASSR